MSRVPRELSARSRLDRRPVSPPCRCTGGGIGALLKRHSPWPDLPLRDGLNPSLFSLTVEEAFLFVGHYSALRHRDRADDRRTSPQARRGCRRRPGRAALDTVSDPDVAGALEGRRLPAIVTCRPAWEGGQFRGSEEERRRDPAGGARARRRVRRHRVAGEFHRPHRVDSRPPRRALDARLRRRAGRSGGASRGDARDRRGSHQAGRQDDAPQRLPAAARSRRRQIGRDRRQTGADRHGRVRPGHARASRRNSDRSGRTRASSARSDR